MILTRDKLAFVHAQKTGGTSVIGRWLDDPDVLEHRIDYRRWHMLNEERLRMVHGVLLYPTTFHRTLALTKQDISKHGLDPDTFRFFTVVRNPWQALRSAHRFNIKIGLLRHDAPFDPTVHSSMLRFFANVADCADLFDRVLRCETLEHDLDAMLAEWDVQPPFSMRRWNATDKVECSTRLTYDNDEQVEMLVGLLEEYCERFNYPSMPE